MTISEYLAFKVVTNINIVRNNALELPAVKICSLNPTTKNYSLKDVVISCKFSERLDCLNETFLTLEYDQLDERRCLKFNYNSNLSVKRAGMYTGLVIKIFDGTYNEQKSDPLNFTESDGLKVYIHNKSILVSLDEGTPVSLGVTSYLKIHRLDSQELGDPYNPCINDLETYRSYHSFDSAIYEEITNLNYLYRQKDCFLNYVLKSVPCGSSFSNHLGNCSKEFMKGNIMSFYETQMDLPMKMLIDCPRECKTVSYEINYSNSNYPSYTEYLNLLNNSYLMSKYLQTPSVEDIKKSMATLYIYYDDLRYTSISQQPKMMFFDLISSIGGLFGLFLGASFLSFADLVEVILVLFHNISKKLSLLVKVKY